MRILSLRFLNLLLKLDPKDIQTSQLHSIMLGAVQPRPIAFASTVDENGVVNLSPYSFFNVFVVLGDFDFVLFQQSLEQRDKPGGLHSSLGFQLLIGKR